MTYSEQRLVGAILLAAVLLCLVGALIGCVVVAAIEQRRGYTDNEPIPYALVDPPPDYSQPGQVTATIEVDAAAFVESMRRLTDTAARLGSLQAWPPPTLPASPRSAMKIDPR